MSREHQVANTMSLAAIHGTMSDAGNELDVRRYAQEAAARITQAVYGDSEARKAERLRALEHIERD